MEVNAHKIKRLRQEKSWTQQHMADACGLSLRTIQRIERYGNCSAESLQALASVLELDIWQLKTVPVPEKHPSTHLRAKHSWLRNAYWISFALLIGFVGGFSAALNL